jgi:hypothetical protein
MADSDTNSEPATEAAEALPAAIILEAPKVRASDPGDLESLESLAKAYATVLDAMPARSTTRGSIY